MFPLKSISGPRAFPRVWDAFSLGRPVYPVAVKVRVPFGLRIGLLTRHRTLSHVMDYLFIHFVPRIQVDLECLPAQERQPDETAAEFADRVQGLMADHLDVPSTNLTPEDKRALRGRIFVRSEPTLHGTPVVAMQGR